MDVGRNAVSCFREINHADPDRSKNDLLYHDGDATMQSIIF
jgi:hypothetical protein